MASERPAGSRLSFEERQLRTFISDGRLLQMPRQQKKKLPLLRYIARSAFEVDTTYEEREVNRRLSAFNDDVATLRRLLVDHGFAERHAGIYRLRPEEEWPKGE